ncbi:MAG: GNAT family N-acetyltransferase [Dehalococcoidia bacterium]
MDTVGGMVTRASTGDGDAVAAILTRAFADDPVYRWFMRERFPLDLLQDHFRHEVADYLDSAEVYLAAGAAGAALWRPAPGAQPSPLIGLLRAMPGLSRYSGPLRLHRLWRLIRATEARYPREPHRYLYLVGVEPEHQGRGVGSALIRAGLEACDRDRLPAYLESSKARNVPLYVKHGFRVVERLDLARRGPSLWLMWRDAP